MAIHLPLHGGDDGASDREANARLRDRLKPPGGESAREAHRRALDEPLRGASNGMRHVGTPPRPRAGDARVSFMEVPFPSEGVSVLAEEGPGGRLRPWRPQFVRDAHRAEPSLFRMMPGAAMGSVQMLRRVRRESDRVKWMLRALGTVLLWGGSYLGLSWIPRIAVATPWIGNLLESVAGPAVAVMTLLAAVPAAALIIAAGWARFRPMHASLLGLGAAMLLGGQGYWLKCRVDILGASLEPRGWFRWRRQ